MEERLIELETRFSFQEDTIETLSSLIADQQAQIDALKRHVDIISKLLQRLMHEDSLEDS